MADFLWKQIVDNTNIISLAASLATVVGLFLAWLSLRRTARSVQASTLMQIHRDSRDLTDRILREPKLIEVLQGTENESACPKARTIVSMMHSHYAAIFYQWMNDTLDDRFWPYFRAEMKTFAQYSYVKENLSDACVFGRDYAQFLKNLSED